MFDEKNKVSSVYSGLMRLRATVCSVAVFDSEDILSVTSFCSHFRVEGENFGQQYSVHELVHSGQKAEKQTGRKMIHQQRFKQDLPGLKTTSLLFLQICPGKVVHCSYTTDTQVKTLLMCRNMPVGVHSGSSEI